VAAQQRDRIPAVRAYDDNGGVRPLVVKQRGDLPDNNPHRHQGNDPFPAAKDPGKDFRRIRSDIGTEECSYPFGIVPEIREGDNHGVGHE
jgi:hypothetical protein